MPPDYPFILRSLKEGQCVLFLGPEVCMLPDGATTFSQERIRCLQENNLIKEHYQEDNLVLFHSETHRTRASFMLKDLYKTDTNTIQATPPFFVELYEKIMELPFHLIVSASPDQFLDRLMTAHGVPHSFGYFDRRNVGQVDRPTTNAPLIYNLLGKVDDFESLVLTYDDLYKYLAKVLPPKGLPDNLTAALDKSNFNHAILLGFPLNKWWVQLLLRLFGLSPAIETYATTENFDDSFEDFCRDNFNITLVRENFVQFMNDLYEEAKNPNYEMAMRLIPSSLALAERPEIFISYAWGGSREDIVNKLYDSLLAKGYNVVRDKINLGYKGNIQDFMTRIGLGKLVVVVISEKYLKSPNCMFEALEMERNPGVLDRIYPIVLDDAKIYDPTTQIDYINYWDSKIKELEEKLRTTNLAYIQSIIQQLDTFNDIRRIVADFMNLIRNMNALTPEIHAEQDFEDLINAMNDQIGRDRNHQNPE